MTTVGVGLNSGQGNPPSGIALNALLFQSTVSMCTLFPHHPSPPPPPPPLPPITPTPPPPPPPPPPAICKPKNTTITPITVPLSNALLNTYAYLTHQTYPLPLLLLPLAPPPPALFRIQYWNINPTRNQEE